jgi:hypothetical protein
MCKILEEKNSGSLEETPTLANLSVSTIESLREMIEGREA